MTVQDHEDAGEVGKAAGQDEKDDRAAHQDEAAADEESRPTEKPEPDEDDKKVAAEMMTAYEDKPTIVLPGSGGMVSGTAVNDWLDEDGNPKYEVPDGADSEMKSQAEEAKNDEKIKDQIEKDKALNRELAKAAGEDNKGEKR
ncbi:hypothetical protein [Mycobacterium parmense]|uniref:Uncharacterized protein n=1 Tax=Mycobacterium parmense TaxID=185642 RepID=A0A7I7YNS3_9MYCO|nr:hypothetical protein [Mycobacterium parmense]ORW51027.1 hypothetical protein AWC20_23450 [Mycobacterium parmense]BBZ43506.1 hypothetical protein MPRM_07870 [Mycobacterium parmense]